MLVEAEVDVREEDDGRDGFRTGRASSSSSSSDDSEILARPLPLALLLEVEEEAVALVLDLREVDASEGAGESWDGDSKRSC